MPDYPPHSCTVPWEEAGDVNESHDWYVVAVTRSDESRRFYGCKDIQTSCQYAGLVPNDSDRVSVQSCEANYNILCIVL